MFKDKSFTSSDIIDDLDFDMKITEVVAGIRDYRPCNAFGLVP